MTGRAHPLDDLLGVRYQERSAEVVTAELTVEPRLHQSAGIVHGGVIAALVESAVGAGAELCAGEGRSATGVENQVHFLRPVRSGILRARATPVHRGRTQQLWTAEVLDTAGRLVAYGLVRLLNVDNRAAAPASTEERR